jgi:hypothetical protein
MLFTGLVPGQRASHRTPPKSLRKAQLPESEPGPRSRVWRKARNSHGILLEAGELKPPSWPTQRPYWKREGSIIT